MHVVERMVQDIALRLDVLHEPPNRLHRQHRLLPKGIDLLPAHKRDLLQLQLVRAVADPRLAVPTPAHDGQPRAVSQAVAVCARVFVAAFEDVLGDALQGVLVDLVERSEAAGLVGDKTMARRPAADVESDEVGELLDGSLDFDGEYEPPKDRSGKLTIQLAKSFMNRPSAGIFGNMRDSWRSSVHLVQSVSKSFSEYMLIALLPFWVCTLKDWRVFLWRIMELTFGRLLVRARLTWSVISSEQASMKPSKASRAWGSPLSSSIHRRIWRLEGTCCGLLS